MPPRLTESYRVGDRVEIYLSGDDGESWRPGRVVQLQHPGVWVMTLDNHHLWFVTNGRHIRRHDDVPDGAN